MGGGAELLYYVFFRAVASKQSEHSTGGGSSCLFLSLRAEHNKAVEKQGRMLRIYDSVCRPVVGSAHERSDKRVSG
eukprot:IDg9666t1